MRAHDLTWTCTVMGNAGSSKLWMFFWQKEIRKLSKDSSFNTELTLIKTKERKMGCPGLIFEIMNFEVTKKKKQKQWKNGGNQTSHKTNS